MIGFELTYKPYGEQSILIEWPARIDPTLIRDIHAFNAVLQKQQQVKETIVAYNSILVKLINYQNYPVDVRHKFDFERITEKFQKLYFQRRVPKQTQSKVWEIPVCYDLEFGRDLEELSKSKNLSIPKIIELHTQTAYLIYFFGFQPGFMYLGGLHHKLHTPRRANPRLRVEKGSVGIGGAQTGIYPQDSAGGWNILGRSPIDFFDSSKKNPCFAKPGDLIQFKSISPSAFFEIKDQVEGKEYQPKFSRI